MQQHDEFPRTFEVLRVICALFCSTSNCRSHIINALFKALVNMTVSSCSCRLVFPAVVQIISTSSSSSRRGSSTKRNSLASGERTPSRFSASLNNLYSPTSPEAIKKKYTVNTAFEGAKLFSLDQLIPEHGCVLNVCNLKRYLDSIGVRVCW